MRMIIYNGGREYFVNVSVSTEDGDETLQTVNRIANWLCDAAEVNKDRDFPLTAERIWSVTKQITSALESRGLYTEQGA